MEFGVAVLVNRSFRSALAARLARIPKRIGFATEGRGFLLTHRVEYDPVKFEAECYLDLLAPLGIAGGSTKPRLTLAPAEIKSGSLMLCGANVGVQPGARYPEKQLSAEKMAGVAKMLASEGWKPALLGGPDEAVQAKLFAEQLDFEAVTLVGKTSIRMTMGVLANLKLMIGSDTGLMHVAAAVGCPTVTVFGPNPASKWGHRYAPHKVVEAPEGDIRRVSAIEVLNAAREVLASAAQGSQRTPPA
jgi:heptosyltransferase-2